MLILHCLKVLGKPASHIYLGLTEDCKHTCLVDFGARVGDASDYTIEGCPIYTNWYDPYQGMFLFKRLVRVVQVVKQCFTGRTVGELYVYH